MSKIIVKITEEIFRDLTTLGGFVFTGIVILLSLVLQEIDLFLALLLGAVITTGLVILIRLFYFKNRPNKEEHNTWIERIDASAFPSLHAARVSYTALTLIQFFNDFTAAIFLGLMALAASYSRIFLKKHDRIDVLAGIGLGVAVYAGYRLLFL
ncbi:MAG TPA: phosphatase PAP2 family protein [Candidatus Nanoarchaeia archaeon]|nr:phosphatase PAP2 family protein [Candidatus Nanoarchaeia archaeon]